MFKLNEFAGTRGHLFRLYKKAVFTMSSFGTNRIINTELEQLATQHYISRNSKFLQKPTR